jgi:RecB family endonuclease NucS
LIFILLGFRIDKEHKTNIGRIDAIVFHNDNVYVFEFKKNKTAQDAISQIHDRGYYKKYQNTGKNIYLIGMNYNTDIREIDDYLIEQI